MSESWLGTSSAPLGAGFSITPHDSNELASVPRAVYVGGQGTLVIVLDGDTAAVTLVAVPAGTLLPIRARVVKATGTTATNLVALL